jgi:glutamyl-tRNA synthetase
MQSSTVRTRIAPSPTGDVHVGNAYIALVNFCFARQQGGQFILRIEDTDQARSTVASEQMILRSFRWLGLSWDEGPDVGGPHAPYRQSERSEFYRKYADQLLNSGHAFRCFCTADTLKEMRQQQPKGAAVGYDGRCKALSASEVARLQASGRPSVIRMDVPREGKCSFQDLLRGTIEIDWATVDMQILLKSDGMPTYHLANVVDDHLMQISHVLRGEEWVPSAPKHLLLYKYFGWDPPILCHLPLLRNPDRSKLSKRKNPTSMLWYERMGYLPEALMNFLGLMALSIPSGEEKFDLQGIIERFDITKLPVGGPVFDLQKLAWLNGRWLREGFNDTELLARLEKWGLNRDHLLKVVKLAQPRLSLLSDFVPLTAFLFSGDLQLPADKFTSPKIPADAIRKSFQFVIWDLDALRNWNEDVVRVMFTQAAERGGYKLRDFLRPFYMAIAGRAESLPLFDSIVLLGRDLTRDRLRNGLQALGGVSNKERDLWKAEWERGSKGAEEGHEDPAQETN